MKGFFFHTDTLAFNLAHSYSAFFLLTAIFSPSHLSLSTFSLFHQRLSFLSHFLRHLRGIKRNGERGRGQPIHSHSRSLLSRSSVHFRSRLLLSSSRPWPILLSPTLCPLLPLLSLTPLLSSHFGMIDDHDALLLGSLLTSWSWD